MTTRASGLKKGNMFARMLFKSLKNRRTRIAIAVLAVLLGASLVSALTSVSLDARGKAGKELRSYGANILLLPRSTSLEVGTGGLDFGSVSEQNFIPEASLPSLQSDEMASNLAGYASYLYGVAKVAGQKVVLAGTRFGDVHRVSPWWQITGNWPEDNQTSYALVGSEAARKLGLQVGSTFEASYDGRLQKLTVAGVVDTGATEDSQIFVSLPAAQELLNKTGLVSLVQVSTLTDRQPVAATASQIEKQVPEVRAKVIGQIAEAEAGVLSKIELLMAIVAILVLFASALTVVSTMTTTVLERTKEIGLLKALGAGKRRIALLFLSEAATIGVFGGLLGYLVGILIAQFIGQQVFGSAISFQPVVLPLSLIVALGVTILASVIPVKRAVDIDPVITLRGE